MKRNLVLVALACTFGLLAPGCQTCAGGDDSPQQQRPQASPAPGPSSKLSPRRIHAPLGLARVDDDGAAAPAASADSDAGH